MTPTVSSQEQGLRADAERVYESIADIVRSRGHEIHVKGPNWGQPVKYNVDNIISHDNAERITAYGATMYISPIDVVEPSTIEGLNQWARSLRKLLNTEGRNLYVAVPGSDLFTEITDGKKGVTELSLPTLVITKGVGDGQYQGTLSIDGKAEHEQNVKVPVKAQVRVTLVPHQYVMAHLSQVGPLKAKVHFNYERDNQLSTLRIPMWAWQAPFTDGGAINYFIGNQASDIVKSAKTIRPFLRSRQWKDHENEVKKVAADLQACSAFSREYIAQVIHALKGFKHAIRDRIGDHVDEHQAIEDLIQFSEDRLNEDVSWAKRNYG